MNAKLPPALSVLLLVALSACTTASVTRLSDVRSGMTKSEVVTVLGHPDSINTHANVEYLTYYLKPDAAGRELPYMVRLVDQHVESFGRYFPLLEVYPRPVGDAQSIGMGAVMPYSMNTDILTQLQQLKALKDQAVLTEEEFTRAKQRLLAERD